MLVVMWLKPLVTCPQPLIVEYIAQNIFFLPRIQSFCRGRANEKTHHAKPHTRKFLVPLLGIAHLFT